jgi:hypothetical protein
MTKSPKYPLPAAADISSEQQRRIDNAMSEELRVRQTSPHEFSSDAARERAMRANPVRPLPRRLARRLAIRES